MKIKKTDIINDYIKKNKPIVFSQISGTEAKSIIRDNKFPITTSSLCQVVRFIGNGYYVLSIENNEIIQLENIK